MARLRLTQQRLSSIKRELLGKEPVSDSARIRVRAHDLAARVDPERNGGDCTGTVDGRELAFAQHEAVLDASDSIPSHDHPSVVDPERFRAVRAGEVKRGEDALVQQKAVQHGAGVDVTAQDRASVGDVLGDGFGRSWVVYGSENAVAKQETVSVQTSHRVKSHNLALVVDPPGFREQRTREVERGKRAVAQDEPVLGLGHDPMCVRYFLDSRRPEEHSLREACECHAWTPVGAHLVNRRLRLGRPTKIWTL
jgi:hypothetical protein